MEVVEFAGFETSLPRHFHETFTLGIIASGRTTFEQGGDTHIATVGNVILTAPGTIHSGRALGPAGARNVVLYAPTQLLSSLLDGADLTGAHFSDPVIRDRQAEIVMQELISTLLSDDPRLRKETIFSEAVRYLFDLYLTVDAGSMSRFAAPSAQKVLQARDYLQANFRNSITLKQLAKIAGCSRFQLIEQFNRQIGMPPHSYQIQLRLQLAQHLLRRGHAIVEVAAECGFFDQSHLTRHFKKNTGVPPSYYRRPKQSVKFLWEPSVGVLPVEAL